MTIKAAARDTTPEPEDVEPNGYVRLVSAETGVIDLRADMLPLIRHHQSVDTEGWVSMISRYGAPIDFRWQDIREIEVRSPEVIANETRIDGAYARVFEVRDKPWQ